MNSETFPLLGKFRLGWAIFWSLAAALVFALVTGMDDSIRNFPINAMFAFGFSALIFGWVFSASQRRSSLVLIGGMSLGLLLLIIFHSGAIQNLYLTFIYGFRLNRGYEPFQRYPVNSDLFLFFLNNALINLFDLGTQIFNWFMRLLSSRSRFDPLISQIIWGGVLWAASFSTGWLFRRKKHAFVSSLPMTSLLVGILGYTRQKSTGLTIAVGALLMIIVLLEHLRKENEWDTEKVDYSEAVRLDLAFLAIPIIFAILLTAITVPNISFDAIRDFYNQIFFIEDQSQVDLDESLGLQRNPQTRPDQEISGVLPRELLIGSGPELSENLVMEIDTGEIFIPHDIDMGGTIPKYYWFGRSYDIYTGRGWLTSEIDQRNFSKNEIINPVNLEHIRVINLEVKKARNAQETLYASGVPISVDHRVMTGWRESTDEYYSAQIDATTYQVTSPVIEVPEEALRQSTDPIPDKILNTYLQVPEEIPPRIKELAVDLTKDINNTYDKAKAIESYLRQFEYTLDVPKPDPNQDVVDFFLFDLQKGYCDYFASAMVILSRSVGIPGRLAVGYTRGNYDYTRQLFVVTEANAHAWPEIYIAPYGWVPFEPTTSEVPFGWDLQEMSAETNGNGVFDVDEKANTFWLNLLILVGIIMIISFFGFLWYKFTKTKSKRKPTEHQIETIYQRMIRMLTDFLIPVKPSKTPYEYQKDVIRFINDRKSSKAKRLFEEPISSKIDIITQLYTQGIYSSVPITTAEVKIARKNLIKLFFTTIFFNFYLFLTGTKT